MEDDIPKALKEERYSDLAFILERRFKDGLLGNRDALALGVMLMLPPCADFEASQGVFAKLFGTSVGLEAAVWSGYLYTRLLPTNTSFVSSLLAFGQSAEALYMLAEYSAYLGDIREAIEWVDRALKIRRFPNALIFLANNIASADNSRELLREAYGLLRHRAAEKLAAPLSVEDFLTQRWEELITGFFKTASNVHELEVRINRLS